MVSQTTNRHRRCLLALEQLLDVAFLKPGFCVGIAVLGTEHETRIMTDKIETANFLFMINPPCSESSSRLFWTTRPPIDFQIQ